MGPGPPQLFPKAHLSDDPPGTLVACQSLLFIQPLKTPLLSRMTRYSRLFLSFPCLRPGTARFPKSSGPLYEKWCRDSAVGMLSRVTATGLSLLLGLSGR